MGKKAQAGKTKPKIDENGVLLVPPPRTVANQDHFHRLNYLYQLSVYQTRPRPGAVKGHTPLARNYIKSMDLISKKTKTSLLPTIKRTICKKCHRLLVWTPKRLAITRDGALSVVCGCGAVKHYNVGADPNYRTYSEREGNLLNP